MKVKMPLIKFSLNFKIKRITPLRLPINQILKIKKIIDNSI